MNRNTRTLIVIFVAIASASLATYGVRRAIQSMPVKEVEVPHTYVVAAARALPTGALVTADDVKLVPWPERAKMPGSYAKVETVVNRGIIAPVLENEPLTESKLAPI